mmetsp:Transcript_47228/g.92147  ORF Transcript_47228/g.92147 Transcript_47228/m.92147 type:complete len:173 (+) Transcript_47228:155-673(+)
MELRKKCLLSFCPGPETTAAAVGPSYEISWAIGSSNIILNYSRDFEKELERSARCKRKIYEAEIFKFLCELFFRTANAAADSRLMHFFQQCGCGSGFKAHAFFSRTTDAICLRSKFKFLILNIYSDKLCGHCRSIPRLRSPATHSWREPGATVSKLEDLPKICAPVSRAASG